MKEVHRLLNATEEYDTVLDVDSRPQRFGSVLSNYFHAAHVTSARKVG
jgi:hypothetical protein